MQYDNDKKPNSNANDVSLETADAVARAAHLWIRSLCLSELQTEAERRAIASGLIAGLCARLALDSRIQELVTYAYTLLDDEGGQALAVSRLMLDQPIARSMHRAYDKGKSEAEGIVEMISYHSHH
jgi:hypothetical protein